MKNNIKALIKTQPNNFTDKAEINLKRADVHTFLWATGPSRYAEGKINGGQQQEESVRQILFNLFMEFVYGLVFFYRGMKCKKKLI